MKIQFKIPEFMPSFTYSKAIRWDGLESQTGRLVGLMFHTPAAGQVSPISSAIRS